MIAKYRHKADFWQIRLESEAHTDLFLRNHRWESVSETLAIGGHVRACIKGGWGFASFTDWEQLEAQLEVAITAAAWVGDRETQLAPVPVQQIQLPAWGDDPRQTPISAKRHLCQDYHDRLSEHDLTSYGVRYGDQWQQIWLATSEGSLIEQSGGDWELRVFATASSAEHRQTGRDTTGSRRSFKDLLGRGADVDAAAQRAITALTLPTVPSGTYPVVIDPILTGLFVHEAFGHLSEADMVYENPDLLASMELGRRFGAPILNIWDGAAPPGHRGSYAFDDEATPATNTQLIKEGRLAGRLHSRETAGVLGEAATGNARCLDFHYAPIVRMTNTWIERGTTPAADLYAGIELGIHAANWQGGMTNGEMFTFSAAEARWIRQGELAEPVRDVTLSGNVFHTLNAIEAIGDDFVWDESGGCGKGNQDGLAVGVGGPSLRLREVVVG